MSQFRGALAGVDHCRELFQCCSCGGTLRVRAVVTDPTNATRILDALQAKRARDPPGDIGAA